LPVIVLIISCFSLLGGAYSFYRCHVQPSRSALFWIFAGYLSVTIFFGGIYYGIYTDYVGNITFRLKKAMRVYDELPAPEEAAKIVGFAMNTSRGPFLINGELDTVQFYFTGTLEMNSPKGIEEEIAFLRKMSVPEETWSSEVDQGKMITPSEKEAISLIFGLVLSEEGANLLRKPEVKWSELVPVLRQHSDEGLARAVAFRKSRYLSAVRLFEEWNTGVRTYVNFLYFSLVTITTLGYGDILPNDPLVRVVVMVEVILGLGIVVFFVSAIGSRKAAQPG